MTGADPVALGFVASLNRPGGNVTGLAMQTTDLVGKRLSPLREVIPNLRRLAIMANVEYPFAALEMAEAQTTAGTLGLDAAVFEIGRAEDIAPAFEALKDRWRLRSCTPRKMSGGRAKWLKQMSLLRRLST